MPSEAVVVAAVRTPVGRAPRGSLARLRPDDLAALALRAGLARLPAGGAEALDDVIVGCAMPEGLQGYNLGRVVALRAGLPVGVPGFTVNRWCASGLEAVAVAADRVRSGGCRLVAAVGVESMSRVPFPGEPVMANPELLRTLPDLYLSMGQTAEVVAERYGIGREAQDDYAWESHRRAAVADFGSEVIPVAVQAPDPAVPEARGLLLADECIRREPDRAALARLRPVFREGGTVTAGNACPLSDGAACVVLASEALAAELDLPVLGVFRSYAVAGVEPAVMGTGPAAAVPLALRRAAVAAGQVAAVELNEAFAVQALADIRLLDLDPARVNPRGGAIALGHPLGCSGARLVVTLLHGLGRTGGGVGLASLCVGGGMGVAAVFGVPRVGEAA